MGACTRTCALNTLSSKDMVVEVVVGKCVYLDRVIGVVKGVRFREEEGSRQRACLWVVWGACGT